MDSPHDRRPDRDAPAMPSEAHLRAAMEQSEREAPAGQTVPLADVLAELGAVVDRIEARRARRVCSDIYRLSFAKGCVVMDFERGSTNVYADLGFPDVEEMLVKAQLATRIGEGTKRRRLTLVGAAERAGLPLSKLSGLLRGQFRDLSQADMLSALARLVGTRAAQIAVRRGVIDA